MEAKTMSKPAVAVAGTSAKPSLKRKADEELKELEENDENQGPIPIVKLEVCLHLFERYLTGSDRTYRAMNH